MRRNPLHAQTNTYTAIVFLLLFLFSTATSAAQCAMCRAALQSEENGVTAEAVNDGIVYLMAIPYILVAIVGYFIYRSRKTLK